MATALAISDDASARSSALSLTAAKASSAAKGAQDAEKRVEDSVLQNETSVRKLLFLRKCGRRLRNKDPMLLNLILESKQIGDQGLNLICDGLKANNTLTLLNLRNNDLDSKGGPMLAAALQLNRTMRTLELGFNKLHDTGIAHICAALRFGATRCSRGLVWNLTVWRREAASRCGICSRAT